MPRHNPTSRSIRASFRQSAGFKIVVVLRIIQSLPLCSLRIRVSSRYSFLPLFLYSPYLSPPLLLILLFFSFSQIWIRFPLSLSSPLFLLSRALVGKRASFVFIRCSVDLYKPLSLPYLLSPPANRRRSSEGCQLPWG